MADLSSNDFSNYFEDVHDTPPFPWQVRLLDQVLTTGWPDVIAMPTGSGKTAIIDIALFSLALEPGRFPRRVFFVVDRRIIVDQVHARAKRIHDRISESHTPTLAAVRASLRSVSGGTAFGTSRLRGGGQPEREWALRPDQPWVTVATVDQLGSRLLFRGYGVSERMKPIHAGLVGNDALVILDEVHLSRPFSETLAALADRSAEPISKKFHVVEMSATADASKTRFTHTADDLERSTELRRRLMATKSASLRKVGTAKQPSNEAIPVAVAKLIPEIPDEARLVGIVVNRVKTAREVYRRLSEQGNQVDLLTGRMRPIDRSDLLARLENVLDPDSPYTAERRYVVATQAIEVGADFSFDALITECAPIDSLRQRFGRLDRRGTFADKSAAPSRAWILGVAAEVDGSKDDPVYGQALRNTWNELGDLFGANSFDVGPLSALDVSEACRAPSLHAPLLLPSHMEAWCQTSPEPPVQPKPHHFLHGLGAETDTDVSLVFRYDRSQGTLDLCRPRPSEYLPVPISAAKAWFSELPETVVADVDVSAPEVKSEAARRVGVWREGKVMALTLADLRPGEVVLLDPRAGGLTAANWDPTSTEPVADLGDRAQSEYGGRVVLRLDPRLYSDAPVATAEDDGKVTSQAINDWLETQKASGAWLAEACDKLTRRHEIRLSGSKPQYPILVQKLALDETDFDGSDETQSHTGLGTSLSDHLEGVGRRARLYAERLGLSSHLIGDIELAAKLHDLGKVEDRFQLVLVGGDEVELVMRSELLAKSLPGVGRFPLMPRGFRHELLSVALVESNTDILPSAADPELVLHLIGSHHGLGRPLPTVVSDPDPTTIRHSVDGFDLVADTSLARSDIAIQTADRFWTLQKRYGIYGLAWLETILRLADHRESADPEGEI